MRMEASHGMESDHDVIGSTPLEDKDAEQIARVMSALASASRIRILANLRRSPCAVGTLASSIHMAQPAVSQHLRVLRDLGLVTSSRSGRQTVYSLYDDHVQGLLDEASRHLDHVRAGDSARNLSHHPDPLNRKESQ